MINNAPRRVQKSGPGWWPGLHGIGQHPAVGHMHGAGQIAEIDTLRVVTGADVTGEQLLTDLYGGGDRGGVVS